MQRFTFYDKFLTFISLLTYLADVATDVWLIVYFFTNDHLLWGSLMLAFVVMATLAMQVFSFVWHVADRTLSWCSLITHVLLLAPVHRYVRVLHLGRKSQNSGSMEVLSAAYREMNDVSIIRLIMAFLQSAPQLVLQLYIVLTNLDNFNVLLGFSMVFSLISVSWSVTSYTDALHLAYKKFYKRHYVSMFTHFIWQTGMLTARVVSIALFASVFHGYVGLAIGVHLIIMIIWIAKLQPEFGSTPCERHLFTVVAAAIHIFSFLNVKDGPSRYRMVFYYIVMLVETGVYMVVWYMCKQYVGPIWFDVTAFSVVLGAFALGTLFMLLYYGCCHPSGPVPIPSQKPEFLKPGNQGFGIIPCEYKQIPPQQPPHEEKTAGKHSNTAQPSIFDVTSTSARINLWLSASLDLSKEGLVDNPDTHLDPTLLSDNHSYLRGNQKGENPDYSQCNDSVNYRNVSSIQSPVDVYVSPLGSGSSCTAYPLLGRSQMASYTGGSYRDRLVSDINSNSDRLDISSISRMTDREHSMPDYNLVEMFARCKIDPSFVSNTSISDILFNQTGKFQQPENQSGKTLTEQQKDLSDISASKWNQSKVSNDSAKSLTLTANTSRRNFVEQNKEQSDISASKWNQSKVSNDSAKSLTLTADTSRRNFVEQNKGQTDISASNWNQSNVSNDLSRSLVYTDDNSRRTMREQNNSLSDIAAWKMNYSKVSSDSEKSLIYSPNRKPKRSGPASISPLDPSKLCEESESRLKSARSVLCSTGSDTALHQSGERNPIVTVTLDAARGISRLSLSYSDLNMDSKLSDSGNQSKRNSALSETANSSVFMQGANKSIDSLSDRSNTIGQQSEMISFSDVSLQLPDSSNSRNGSLTQPDIVNCASPQYIAMNEVQNASGGRRKSPKSSSIDNVAKFRTQSMESFRREYSPSDRQSSYLSDCGVSSSDRGLSSSNSTSNRSGYRSSSGFQSEESNLSTTSPVYSNFCHRSDNQHLSTPVIENEISTVSQPLYSNFCHRTDTQHSSIPVIENEISSVSHPVTSAALTNKRVSLDHDVYVDALKFKNSTPDVDDSSMSSIGQNNSEFITPITGYNSQNSRPIIGSASMFYEEKTDGEKSPVLPPVGWSRRSSSTGSSGSGGRFFKDPTLDDYDSQSDKKSDDDFKYRQSVDSKTSTSGNMDRSSLSAYLSEMSSSKCDGTRTSIETSSLASSDPDSLRRNISLNSLKKAESLPYVANTGMYMLDSQVSTSLSHQLYNRHSINRSQDSIQVYENINNYSGQNRAGSRSSSSLNMSSSDDKTVAAYLCNTESEKIRMQQLYDEYSQARSLKSAEILNRNVQTRYVPDYVNVIEISEDRPEDGLAEDFGNVIVNRENMFNRNEWRASLDKEMRDRLVSDIEKLAPKKLFQLRSKVEGPRKKLSPVNIDEYNESPYKFRKSASPKIGTEYENINSFSKTDVTEYNESPYKVRKSGNSVRKPDSGSLKSNSVDSLSREYENIETVASYRNANYANIDGLLIDCPIASPESLSDTVFVDEVPKKNKGQYSMMDNVRSELYQDSLCVSASLQENNLSRTKSPINTSGLNSAFKPVKGRTSVESQISSSGSDKTYIVDEISSQNCGFVQSGSNILLDDLDKSRKSQKNSKRQSIGSQYSSESGCSFQWSQNSENDPVKGLSESLRQSPRNYLQLAGTAPLNFSVPSFLNGDTSSQCSSKHSCTDSIPWEDSAMQEKSLSQQTSDIEVRPTPRQPLKALENTPMFSPIYGQERGINLEMVNRKRFMSTPKLSAGSELSLSKTSEDSMSRTPHRRRSSGIMKNNTSTWSSQSESDITNHVHEHSTFALSKTTYI